MKQLACSALLAISLAILAAGCSTTKVVPLESRMTFNYQVDSLGERKPYTAVIMPFTDGRETEFVTNKWATIPGIGLLIQYFLATKHTMPEVTFNHYPAMIKDIAGGQPEYLKGEFTHTIPVILAGGLKEAGVFKEVKVAEKLDENFDMRDYDYVIRGRVKQTDLKVTEMTYGLNIFDWIDLSNVLKILPVPDKIISAKVAYEMEIVERQTNKSVWKGQIDYPKRVGWVHPWYYGNRVEGASPNVGLFTLAMKENLSETINQIKKEVKY